MSTRTRVSVDDWVAAGLAIMTADGVGGVKIHRLCDRLGVTKGSFYWHFRDLDEYLGAVAQQWQQGDGAFRAPKDDSGDPETVLPRLVAFYVDQRLSHLERAMRDWSRSDARARAAIAASDARVFAAIRDAFAGLGFDDADADVRAKMLFYAGVGVGDVGPIGDRRPAREQAARMLAILMDRGVSDPSTRAMSGGSD